MTKQALSLVVLISGEGSNCRAIIDAIKQQKINARILAVISNQPAAKGLIYAQENAIPTIVISNKTQELATDLLTVLSTANPDLIVMAGFMRILPKNITQQYEGKIINIHPSLLPKYPGLDTHRRVLAAKDPEHGSTVHFVNDELDAGQIIAQIKLKINPDETETSLVTRIKQLEHILYPQVLQWFADQRITYTPEGLKFDGEPLTPTGYLLNS
jgi:phosphoribosylglycinamide formyltransferase-1